MDRREWKLGLLRDLADSQVAASGRHNLDQVETPMQ